MRELPALRVRPQSWTKEDERVWAGLLFRFPGIEADAARLAAQLKIMEGGHTALPIIKECTGGWQATVEFYLPGSKVIIFPVISDRVMNGKPVKLGMDPHTYSDFRECREDAIKAADIILKHINEEDL